MTTIPAEEIKNFFILISVKLDFCKNFVLLFLPEITQSRKR